MSRFRAFGLLCALACLALSACSSVSTPIESIARADTSTLVNHATPIVPHTFRGSLTGGPVGDVSWSDIEAYALTHGVRYVWIWANPGWCIQGVSNAQDMQTHWLADQVAARGGLFISLLVADSVPYGGPWGTMTSHNEPAEQQPADDVEWARWRADQGLTYPSIYDTVSPGAFQTDYGLGHAPAIFDMQTMTYVSSLNDWGVTDYPSAFAYYETHYLAPPPAVPDLSTAPPDMSAPTVDLSPPPVVDEAWHLVDRDGTVHDVLLGPPDSAGHRPLMSAN